jgi:SH3-like domain-containing protein
VEDGHYEGWVNGKYISMVSPSMYCVTGVADDDVLNMRAYPSTVSTVVAELDPNQCDIAFLPYAVGNWQTVRVDGDEGWVNRNFVSGE